MPDMVRLGRSMRALRRRHGWRQIDLAAKADVSPTAVARAESGGGDRMAIRALDRIAEALGARLQVRLDWNGEALDRLLDADHARLVEEVVGLLRGRGWEVATEVTFSIAGERGSVDILARHPGSATILVVEVKTVVPDVQGMLSAFDRKVRLGLAIGRQLSWHGRSVGRLLVIAESGTSRRRVAAQSRTFESVVPDRAVAVRRWLREPAADSPLRGLWFVDLPAARARHRVRAP